MADSNLREVARGHGVTLSDAQLAQFDGYARLLGEWSQRANLVGDASRDVVERRHFAESVAFGAALRERELLRLLPTHLSNQAVARELFVSLNTVKTHLKSIYRKLGATSRADAVTKARAAGLLP